MKIIIDIPEERLNSIKGFGIKQNEVCMLERALISGTPLDDVKAEIAKEIIPRNSDDYDHDVMYQNCGLRMALKIIDNIGKGE